jgi:hypothetical protein
MFQALQNVPTDTAGASPVDLKAWLDLLAPIAVILSAFAGIVAALFVARQVAHMKRAREVDTFLRILDRGNSEPVCSAANWVKYEMAPDLSYDLARADLQVWQRIAAIEHHFETLGILVERKYVSRDLLFDQMGPWIAGSWAKLQAVIGAHRAARHTPDYAENFELLARSYEKWAEDHPAKLEKRSRASKGAIEQYYRQEARTIESPVEKKRRRR